MLRENIMGKNKSKNKGKPLFEPPPPIDWSDTGGMNAQRFNKLKSQLPADMNPDQLDPAQIAQMQNLFKKMPHQQMQRFQSLMQRAMAGKDVAKEFEDFEKTLSPEMKEAFSQMSAQFGGGAEDAAASTADSNEDMSVEDAKKIIEQAVKEGRLTPEQAQELLDKK